MFRVALDVAGAGAGANIEGGLAPFGPRHEGRSFEDRQPFHRPTVFDASCKHPSAQRYLLDPVYCFWPWGLQSPDVAMAVDPLSPIAPARIRALLLPVGRIKRSRFIAFVDLLQQESLVRLGDISPDPRPDRSMNPHEPA